MSRNLVLCLDGTSNEPETGATNVARIYDLAVKSADQLRRAVELAMERIHALLNDEQRKKLAYYIRTGVVSI